MIAAGAVLLAAGGIPGASQRRGAYDVVAPPVPDEVRDRAGAVGVTVREASGGAPIAGARVRALSIVQERAYLADERETDPRGKARVERVPRGETWILADAPGRARGSTRVVVLDQAREVTIDLQPEHVVDVAVKDDRGASVASAEIEVTSASDPLPVGGRAGANGMAHVGRLGAGPWHVTARAPGYEEASERSVREGETATIVLRKLGAIAVSVVDESARPVAGAHVAVAGAALWPARAADTDARGGVRIGGLAEGTYALRATSGDRASPIELGVLLARGEEKPLVLTLGAGLFVGVVVTDGDANGAAAVGGARVTLAESGISPFPLEATTDARGHARLGPIAAGGATLGVSAEGFVARGAVAVADPPPPETRVALVRGGVLAGRVVDARGFPIDGATIEIVGTDPSGAPIYDDPRRATFRSAHFEAMLSGPAPLVAAGELGVMPGPVPAIPHWGGGTNPTTAAATGARREEPWVTRDDGTFRASPASPGRVRAIARHPQYVEAQSEVVTLAPGGEAHVDLVMHAGGTLEGRVLDAHDRPVEGARVTVSAVRGSLERTTRTAGDGTFAFVSLPESVTVTAGADADEEQPDVRTSVTVAEGGRTELTMRLPEPRGALPVRVVDDRDFAIDAAQVSATSLAAETPLRTTSFTDAHGDATLRRARGVALRVEVSAPGRAPRTVTTDGTEDSLRIALSPAESATGEVRAARGRDAVAGADLTLYTDLGARRARTDASGAFSIAQLAPGPARLVVRAPGYAPVVRAIAVPDSGGRRPFAMGPIDLFAEGIVEGDVTDAHGALVAGARVARDRAATYVLVGTKTPGVAVTDARGHFVLREMAEGNAVLEAYAPDVGRGRTDDVRVASGRTTFNVHIVLAPSSERASAEPASSGGVAVTLGETAEPKEVVVAAVVEGSQAERAGLSPGDVIASVDGAAVRTIEEARARLSGPIADDVLVEVRRGERAMTLRVTREAVRR